MKAAQRMERQSICASEVTNELTTTTTTTTTTIIIKTMTMTGEGLTI
jgi:hypothetical protein